MKTKTFWILILIGVFCLNLVRVETSIAETKLKWGAAVDLSGPTSDMAAQHAWGLIDCIKLMNARGGLNGKKLELEMVDHKYNTQLGIAAYNRFVEDKNVLGLYIQGTGIAYALLPKNNADKIVAIGTNLDADMTVGEKYPYNFCLGPTYSDQARIALKYMVDSFEGGGKPKVCVVRPKGRYGESPLKAIDMYSEELGIEKPKDIIVDWGALDTTSQVLLLKQSEPDYVYITLTAMNAAVVLKDAMRYGLKTQFVADIRTISEQMHYYAREAAEGYKGLTPFATFDIDVPGAKDVKEAAMTFREGKYMNKELTFAYIEGYCYGLTIIESINRAKKNGELTREGIKNALDSFRGVQLGGLYPGVTFTPKDHRGSLRARMFEVKAGKMVPITDYIAVSDDQKYLGK
ncbi:MAG: hypothetical protein C4576_32475 [Desulfobacteraceae bacterium]|jgi:branched-chain amino acid transport system substrate-binding protein|nr:MAG: hypothetical protein C4576_32475 [Desulfobacteraceae bacterium]